MKRSPTTLYLPNIPKLPMQMQCAAVRTAFLVIKDPPHDAGTAERKKYKLFRLNLVQSHF